MIIIRVCDSVCLTIIAQRLDERRFRYVGEDVSNHRCVVLLILVCLAFQDVHCQTCGFR